MKVFRDKAIKSIEFTLKAKGLPKSVEKMLKRHLKQLKEIK